MSNRDLGTNQSLTMILFAAIVLAKKISDISTEALRHIKLCMWMSLTHEHFDRADSLERHSSFTGSLIKSHYGAQLPFPTLERGSLRDMGG